MPGANWSSASSTVGPWYQRMALLRAAMPSPARAEIGMKPVGVTPSPARYSRYSSATSPKRSAL